MNTILLLRAYANKHDWFLAESGNWGTHCVQGLEQPKFINHFVTSVGNHVYAYYLASGEIVSVK